IALHLYVGDHFVSETERVFQKKPTLRWQLVSAKETTDLLPDGKGGKTPVARVACPRTGTYLAAMDRDFFTITLAADKFNRYLQDEGRESIRAERRRAGKNQRPGRERYFRCLKTLIQVGDRRDPTYRRVLGQKLEIVPQKHPGGLKDSQTLPVRISFAGQPLAGAKVFAYHRTADKTHTLSATTDKNGLVEFKLDRPGTWLIRLVHMRRV